MSYGLPHFGLLREQQGQTPSPALGTCRAQHGSSETTSAPIWMITATEKTVRCCHGHYNRVGLQQQRETVPLPAVPIKAGLAWSEEPVPSCTKHQKRRGWSSVKLNCKHRGDLAEFVGLLMGSTRDLFFMLTLSFSPLPKRVCFYIMNYGYVKTLCVCWRQPGLQITDRAVDCRSLELTQLNKGLLKWGSLKQICSDQDISFVRHVHHGSELPRQIAVSR